MWEFLSKKLNYKVTIELIIYISILITLVNYPKWNFLYLRVMGKLVSLGEL